MHRSGPRRVRGEVSTGSAAGESAGRPPVVSRQEGAFMNVGVVPAELVQHWQKVYSEYIAVDRTQRLAPDYPAKVARSSALVAAAWRDLAATPGLAWWLVAALTTAAEAFEGQARAMTGPPSSSDRSTERGGRSGLSGSGGAGFGGQ